MVTSVVSGACHHLHAFRQLDLAQMLRVLISRPRDVDLDRFRNRVGAQRTAIAWVDDVDRAAALHARRLSAPMTCTGMLTRISAPSPSRMKSTCIGMSFTGSSWKSRGITRCFAPSISMS